VPWYIEQKKEAELFATKLGYTKFLTKREAAKKLEILL
jgi:hypothetical protein